MGLGGELNKAWPQEFSPGYKGMVASEDIADGELIAFIPRSMIMTWKEANPNSHIVKELMAKDMLYN